MPKRWGAVLFAGSRFLPDPEMARPLIEKGVADYDPLGELLIGLADGYARLGRKEKASAY